MIQPTSELSPSDLDDLAELLVDAVATGASIGFMAGLAQAEARRWWVDRLASPGVTLIVERDAQGRIVGTVQLVRPTYPNGRHRSELAKLIVHSRARRRGVGERLMGRAEDVAREQGLLLLFLDTETDSGAERLYRRLGWEVAGMIPDFAYRPDRALRPSTFLYRRLS